MIKTSDSEMKNVCKLSISQQKEYYEELKKQCLSLKNNQASFGQDLIKRIYPFLRGYKIEIQGEENIPRDTNVLFVANHSNSHDIFTAYEVLSLLQRKGSVMVATDCLNPITTQIFNISNATLLDRRIKEERTSSVMKMSSTILQGNDGLIFGEGTWNLHPTNVMHNIHNGSAKVSLISGVPIVPVIFEYLEVDDLVSSESKLFKKCIIRFGKPYYPDLSNELSKQSNDIKQHLTKLRTGLWEDYDIKKDALENIDPTMYINHTYAKKFQALGFTYDSEKEQEFLLFLNDELKENEYTLNEQGILVPGITQKNNQKRKLLKK